MKIKKEFREERNDIYSFWKENEKTDVSGNLFIIEEKVSESTLDILTTEQDELTEQLNRVTEKINLIINFEE